MRNFGSLKKVRFYTIGLFFLFVIFCCSPVMGQENDSIQVDNNDTDAATETLENVMTVMNETMAGEDSIDNNRYRYITLRTHAGFHAYSGSDYVSALLKKGYSAVEARIGWQPTNKSKWAKYYGYPSYGFGVYSGFLGDPLIFGKPNALYGFMKFHLTDDWRKNVFSIEPALGLTYNLEPFNPETNPLNQAIGAKMAVYLNVKFGWNYKINRELDLIYGFDFTHMSNGRLYTPNYGLNMVGINVGVDYHYNPDQRKRNSNIYVNDSLLPVRYLRPNKTPNYKLDKSNDINVYGAIGSVQTYRDQGTDVRYTTWSGVLEWQHHFNQAHSITGGFDYFYDGSLIEDYPDDKSQLSHFAVHAGYDLSIWKLTILAHLGTYLKPNPTKPPIFFRPALRYNFNNWMYAQVGLKARGFAADWVEWGIGFKPFRW